jgi:hypothetical protein
VARAAGASGVFACAARPEGRARTVGAARETHDVANIDARRSFGAKVDVPRSIADQFVIGSVARPVR